MFRIVECEARRLRGAGGFWMLKQMDAALKSVCELSSPPAVIGKRKRSQSKGPGEDTRFARDEIREYLSMQPELSAIG